MFFSKAPLVAAIGSLFLGGQASAQFQIDFQQPDTLIQASKVVAANMVKWYTGNQPGQIPGELTQGFYWWEAGAMFGQLIHHWNFTGDTQYNDIVMQALLFQVGQDNDYMPKNQSKDLGNDDQVFWAFGALDAAELGFPNPPAGSPSWLGLAQAVFNTQVPRWETSTCGGGLRWQIYPFNAGYDYKNCISTGGFFQLASRLARYTGNQTYADWAEKSYTWLYNSNIFEKKQGPYIWDGVHMNDNCTAPLNVLWTYNAGTMLMGAAYMYNFTNGNPVWRDRINYLMNCTDVFFVKNAGANAQGGPAPPGGTIMAEVACEFPLTQTCDQDQPSFKAYLSRWMAVTAQLAPITQSVIMPRLQASAKAAAAICTGTIPAINGFQAGQNGCGRRWYQNSNDGFMSLGEQMSAMSIIQNNLILSRRAPLTAQTGGNSTSDPAAGTTINQNILDPIYTEEITTGDKAGAGILTALALALIIGGTSWMIL